MLLLLVHSFWRLQGGAITHEFTLDNYRRLFGTPLYPNTILFSAGIALRVTLLLAAPGLSAGLPACLQGEAPP